MSQTFRIPVPPSTNNLFRNARGRGRVKTERYKTWLQAAGWDVNLARVQPVHGPVEICLAMRRPRADADIDNRIKAPLDLLVAHKVIDDDKHVQRVTVEWADVEGCVITLRAA